LSGINIPHSSICKNSPWKQKMAFSSEPLYEDIKYYTTTIATNGDPADIYYPVANSDKGPVEFPIALLMQGALIDKADYANFASQVASYGFIVVVPNHEGTFTAPTGQTMTGLFPELRQVNDVFNWMVAENANPNSPIAKIVDSDKLGLLGHSFGGLVGLLASQEDIDIPGISSPDYVQPRELKAGIFYGTSFRNPATNAVLPLNNQDIATGLIIGDRDGAIKPGSASETYDLILNPPKALITIEGANHYGITNLDNPIREPNRPTLAQFTTTETIARWSGLFLQAHLQGSSGAFDYIYNTGDALDSHSVRVGDSLPLGTASACAERLRQRNVSVISQSPNFGHFLNLP
jgi:dienelactone hydrolase